MPTVEYSDGTKIEFSQSPTPEAVDEAYSQSKGIAGQEETPNAFGDLYSTPLTMGVEPEMPGTVSRGMVADIAAGLGRGLVQGGQSMISTGVNAYELGSKLFGVTPSDVPRKFLEESQRGLDYFIPPSGTFTEAVAQGVGQIPSMIATYANPISKAVGAIKVGGLLGAVNAQSEGAVGMAVGAAEGVATLALLGKAQQMNAVPGAALGAATMSLPPALRGATPQEVAAQAVLGAGFAVVKPTTPKEVADFVSKVKNISPDYKERFEQFKDALSRDPLDEALRKKESLLQDVREKEAGLSVQEREQVIHIKKRFDEQREAIIKNQDQVLNKTQQEEIRRQNEVKRVMGEATDRIDSEIENFNNNIIPEEAFAQARQVQKALPTLNKDVSRVYNTEYDRVANKIDNNPTSAISAARAREVLASASEKILNDTANDNDPVLKNIHKLLENELASDPVVGRDKAYNRNVRMSDIDLMKQEQQSFLASREPELYKKYIDLKGKENAIPFKEFHAKLKAIWNSAELGSHSAGLLRHTFGDFIAENVPEFQKLQDSYRPILDYKGRLNKIFQLYGSEANLESGVNFLKQFAEGKASPVDRRVLDFLQFGKVEGKVSEFTKGIGDHFMKKIVDLGVRVEKMRDQALMIKDEQAARLDTVVAEFTQRVAQMKLDKTLTEASLAAEQEVTIAGLQMEVARQRMQFQLRKESLMGDVQGKAKIKEMIKKREALEGRFKALSMIVGSFASYKIARLGIGLTNLKRASRHLTK